VSTILMILLLVLAVTSIEVAAMAMTQSAANPSRGGIPC
jgi:hypothetical protein